MASSKQLTGEAYDRAYYRAYGIDPDEVMGRAGRGEPEREPRFVNMCGPGGMDAFWLNATHAVIVEDPNGPHPTAYEYEHETCPWWELRQVYPLEPGRVWSWAAGLRPMDTAEACVVDAARWDDVKRDLSAYWTEEPEPATEGAWCAPERDGGPALDSSALAAQVAAELAGETKPERERPRQQSGRRSARFLGITFRL